jgi:membrane protein
MLQAVNFLFSFALVTLLFAMIYKILPSVHIAWKDVAIGSVITAALFSVGKALIGLYLGNSAVASSYGAAGSVILVLIWVYYSAQIFLLGAEFTKVYAHRYGSRRNLPQPSRV